MDRDKIKDRLRKILEYCIDDYAERVIEIGGLGVGGAEIEDYGRRIREAAAEWEIETREDWDEERKKELRGSLEGMALQHSIDNLWNEAAFSYIYGHFRACIILLASLLEALLKLNRGKGNYMTYDENLTLGTLIDRCASENIIFEQEIIQAAKRINDRRNDLLHFNRERKDAFNFLEFDGMEHELKIVKESQGFIILEYKNAARATIKDMRLILKFFREKNNKNIDQL